MAAPVFRMAWAEADTEATLGARYRAERQVRRRTRLQALWLLRQGRGLGETAAVVGVGKRTVQRWCDWYRQGGVELVLARVPRAQGPASRLSEAQLAQVRTEVATGRFRTAEEIRTWIADTFGVTYRPNSIYTVLERIKAHPKVPRPRHVKAKASAQEAWKKGGSRSSCAMPA